MQRSPRHFQLLRPISFLEAGQPESQRVEIPAHDPSRPAVGDNQTDLASVPPFLWGLIASYGRQTAAALLHDHLSAEARHGDPATHIDRRRVADRLFGVALRYSGISLLRMLIMRSFVSVQKFVEFRPWQAYAMIGHAALGIAFVYAMVGVVSGSWTTPVGSSVWMLVLVLLPAATTLAWWRDSVTMIVVVYAGQSSPPSSWVRRSRSSCCSWRRASSGCWRVCAAPLPLSGPPSSPGAGRKHLGRAVRPRSRRCSGRAPLRWKRQAREHPCRGRAPWCRSA